MLLLGEILIDFLGEGGQALEEAALFRPSPGGAPANAAAAAARAGARARFAGCVGRDAFGRLLRAALVAAGVDCTALIEHDQLFTTLAFVLPLARGDSGFQFMRGADAALSPDHLPDSLFAGAAALGCGGVSLSAPQSRAATLHALRRARAAGATAFFDVNFRPRLWPSASAAGEAAAEAIALADVVKCNEAELELLCGTTGSTAARAATLLRPGGPEAVLVTLAERGALWVSPTAAVEQAGFAVRDLDAVGAGDCFLGTMLAWWAAEGAGRPASLAPERVARALRRACAAAALSTTRLGAIAAMPSAAEVDAFLART